MLTENIVTERLVLREMTKEDAQDVYDIWSTEDNSKYMNDPVESVEEVKAIFESTEPRIGYLLVVTDKKSGEIIGTICPGPTNDPNEWGFGYSFKKSVWGKGYATETLKAIIELGKSEGINKFISECAAENKGSAKVLQKCGMQFDYEDSLRQPHLDVVYESHVYKLIV
ncbi:MAG: GNAT family N-acetyltransferase [Clostridiales bacterium]|nr:GNAT family N-acetyltransferase [Clostridiales bacterium]